MADANKQLPSNLDDLLPSAVKEKYTVTKLPGNSPRFLTVGFDEVDLRTITLKKAEYLVKKDFPYLEKRKAKAAAKSNTNSGGAAAKEEKPK